MSNKKLLQLLSCMFVLFFLISPFTYAVRLSNIEVIRFPEQAVVDITTEEPARLYVNLTGNAPSNQQSNTFSTQHRFIFTNLLPQTTYQYSLISEDRLGQTESHPSQTFSTLGADEIFFYVQAPNVSNGRPIDVQLRTIPYTSVLLLINDQIIGSYNANSAGEISISRLPIPTQEGNHILQFRYTVGSETFTKTHQVYVDPVPPQINFEEIQPLSSSGVARIAGNVSKDVTITVSSSNSQTQTSGPTETRQFPAGNFLINAPISEGDNDIFVTITDRAGNRIDRTFNVFVDTEEPEILSTNLLDLSPSYSREVTVRGKVNKPGLKIKIYVAHQPQFRSGLVPCLSDIYETYQESLNRTTERCQKDELLGEDVNVFTTTSDENGEFSQKIILLSYFSEQSITINTGEETTTEGFNDERSPSNLGAGIEFDNSEADSIVTIFAVDPLGRMDKDEGVVTYGSCSTPGDWVITVGEVVPAKILPDHIFSGVGSISFTYNLEYFGIAPSVPLVEDISLRKRTISPADRDRWIPESIFRAESCIVEPNSGKIDRSYVLCNLQKWPPTSVNQSARYEQLQDMQFLNFPLEFIISYAQPDPFTGENRPKTQRVCADVQVFVDQRLPPKAIPEGLLNDTVNALDQTIDAIDGVLKPLQTINLATTGVCLGSFVVSFFSTVSEKSVCLNPVTGVGPNQARTIEAILRGAPNGQEIEKLREMIDDPEVQKQNSGLQDEQKVYACAEKILSRLKTERFQTLVCDRIMCPVVPTAQYYINDMINAGGRVTSATQASACMYGGVYSDSLFVGREELFNSRDGCGKEYNDEWGNACLSVDPVEESNLLANPDKQTEKSFATSVSQFLNNLDFCRASEDADQDHAISNGRDVYVYNEQTKQYQLGSQTEYTEIINDRQLDPQTEVRLVDRYDLNAYSGDLQDQSYAGQQGVQYTPYVTSVNGRTTLVGAYTDPNGQEQLMRFEPTSDNTRYVQVPGRTKEILATQHTVSYRDSSGNPVTSTYYVDEFGNTYNGPASATDGKIVLGQSIPAQHVCRDEVTEHDYKICESGDRAVGAPAELRSQRAPKTLVNPASTFINALRCGCLPAIEGYLFQIRQILDAIRTCFKGILISGEFNAGLCKAILTQYLCDWIYEAILCVVNAIGADEPGEKPERDDQNGFFKNGFRALSQAGKSVRDRAVARYGNTSSFNALFTQRKLLHSVCLAAFGYDWVPDIQSAISVRGGGFQINSTAGIPVATRRFMGIDPQERPGTNTRNAIYVYHVGYFLFAGSNLNWRLELVCSNDNSCNSAEFNESRCDCSWGNAGQEQTIPLTPISGVDYAQGTVGVPPVSPGGYTPGGYNPYQPYSFGRSYVLRSGTVSAGDSIDQAQTEIYQRLSHPYRYDKVRLTWITSSGTSRDANMNGVTEVKIRTEGEPPVEVCQFQMIGLQFGCGLSSSNEYGDVFFTQNKPPATDKQFYYPGDQVRIVSDISVYYPPELDPLDYVPKFARLQFFDEKERPISPVYQESDKLIASAGSSTKIIMPSSGFTITNSTFQVPTPAVQSVRFVSGLGEFRPPIAPEPGRPTLPQVRLDASDVRIIDATSQTEIPQYMYVWSRNDQCQFVFSENRLNDWQQVQNYYSSLLQNAVNLQNASEYTLPYGNCTVTQYNTTLNQTGQITGIRFVENKNNQEYTANVNVILRDVVIPAQPDNVFMIEASFTESQGRCNQNNELEFIARLSLHDTYVEDPTYLPTRDNARINPAVFIFQGEAQTKDIPIKIKCENR